MTDQAPSRRTRRMAREGADHVPPASASKPPSKAGLIIELLGRPDGASLAELVEATGWLPHTTRAALTGLRKKGHALTSEKIDDVRRYRVAATDAPDANQ